MCGCSIISHQITEFSYFFSFLIDSCCPSLAPSTLSSDNTIVAVEANIVMNGKETRRIQVFLDDKKQTTLFYTILSVFSATKTLCLVLEHI
jgi:hypothetical protein